MSMIFVHLFIIIINYDSFNTSCLHVLQDLGLNGPTHLGVAVSFTNNLKEVRKPMAEVYVYFLHIIHRFTTKLVVINAIVFYLFFIFWTDVHSNAEAISLRKRRCRQINPQRVKSESSDILFFLYCILSLNNGYY